MFSSSTTRLVLLVKDFRKSLHFYRDLLNLTPSYPPSENWVEFKIGDLLLCLHGPWDGMPYNLNDFARSPDELLFRVDDIQKATDFLTAAGIEVSEPHNPSPEIVVVEIADPDGRRIGIESMVKS